MKRFFDWLWSLFRKPKHDIYIVQKGDTLESIAGKFYGDSSKWRPIFSANKPPMTDPSDLKVGQELKIPSLK